MSVGPLGWVAMVWIVLAGGWMMASLNGVLGRVDLGQPWRPRDTERMMRPVGAFQFGVGLFLATEGQWASAPALLLWAPAQWAMFRFSAKFHEKIDKLDHPIQSMTPKDVEEYLDGVIKPHKTIEETIEWLDKPLSKKDAKKLAGGSKYVSGESPHDDDSD